MSSVWKSATWREAMSMGLTLRLYCLSERYCARAGCYHSQPAAPSSQPDLYWRYRYNFFTSNTAIDVRLKRGSPLPPATNASSARPFQK